MKIYVRSDTTTSKTSDFEIDNEMYTQRLTKYLGNDDNVRVPDGVESIGPSAFAKNTNIKSVYIPDTVREIYQYAFEGCVNLKSVRLPSNIYDIPGGMFSGCTNLVKVIIPNNVGTIYYDAFSNCSSLKSINLPDSVVWIQSGAFSGCTSLRQLNLNNVSSIDEYAFENCLSLREIVIPETMVEIGRCAFAGCKNLVSVECLGHIKINENVFVNCEKLKPSNIKFVDGSVFDDSYQDEDAHRDDQGSEVTFDDWYASDKRIDDQNEFIWELESKVRSEYDVAELFEEPSTQGLMGSDNILITFNSGDVYSFSFDFEDEQYTIYSDGPEAAANYYFNQIQEGIDSGSALSD